MTTYHVENGRSLARALVEAEPGDEVVIAPHQQTADPDSPRAYVGDFSVRASGTAENPIRVRALDGAVFSGEWSFESNYVEFDNLLWEHTETKHHIGRANSQRNPIRGLTFRGCQWLHGPGAHRAWYVEDLTYERCHWRDHRTRDTTTETNAWALMRYGKRITFRDCTAEDSGSDWIQIMPNSPVCGPAEEILIENCHAWINRPYGSVPWQDFSSNCGENCIDIKGHETRGVIIRGGAYGGIRPAVPGQDASGDDGPIFRLHFGCRDIRIEQVRFYDAPVGVTVNLGTETPDGYTTGDIHILGCTFEDVERWVRNTRNLDVTVNHEWGTVVGDPPPLDPSQLAHRVGVLRDQAAGIVSELNVLIDDLGRL